MSRGTLYGIGIGPGDPDLITVKGLRLLQSAPVVAYPAPETGDSLARSIVSTHIDARVEQPIEIVMRMSTVPSAFPSEAVYERAEHDIGEHLAAGRDVAVLCEGDPFFYGSFMYVYARLCERFKCVVVPGVSSMMACAATLGAPLASRNDRLSVIPATLDEQALAAAIEPVDAVALIKVGRHLPKLKRVLRDLDLMDRARYVEHATMASERIRMLDDVPDTGAPYFSMVLVHKREHAWRLADPER